MGGYTNGEAITLIISREDLEFLLGGLSVLRAELHGLADESERDEQLGKAYVHRVSAAKAEDLESRLITLL
jgi:hypothetical protein